MVTDVALEKVCALPSACSSSFIHLFIYLFVCMHVCMYVTNFSQKLLGRIACDFQGWFVIIQGPIDQIMGAIRSKVKVKVTKRSKMYFCHNTLSFGLIHEKPTPKCSLFISLSSDTVTHVALAKVCALLSAHSSSFCHNHFGFYRMVVATFISSTILLICATILPKKRSLCNQGWIPLRIPPIPSERNWLHGEMWSSTNMSPLAQSWGWDQLVKDQAKAHWILA